MLNKNTILKSDTGIEYRVISLISSGTGQGDIYKVSSDGTDYALKLFHGENEVELLRQIQALIKRGKACSAYITPVDIVNHSGGIGYIMEYVPETYLSGSVLYNGIDCGEYREALPFHTKLSVLYNIAEAMSVLDKANLAMMDLKFDNLKINPSDSSIKIIDTDTIVRSENGHCFIEGTVGFMPPLTMLRKESPTKYNDYFALAVIIFMTLVGSHPLLGRAGDRVTNCDSETYMLAEHPVYVWHPNDDSNRPVESDYFTEIKLTKYPDAFLSAMKRTFVDGLFEKENRTSPEEWCEILRNIYESSYCCTECGEEHFIAQSSDTSRCDICGSELIKPLLAVGDKAIPLFLGNNISDGELWNDILHSKSFCKVSNTAYSGKYGLMVESGAIKLKLPDGATIEFNKGKIVPLFLDGIYEYNTKEFTLMEV